MGFHSLTLCEDVDLTAFGSVQRPVLYNYGSMIFGKDKIISYLYRFLLLAVPLI